MESTTVTDNRKKVLGLFLFLILAIMIMLFIFYNENMQNMHLTKVNFDTISLQFSIELFCLAALFTGLVLWLDGIEKKKISAFKQKGKEGKIFRMVNEENRIEVYIENIWYTSVKIDQLRFNNGKKEESCLISLMPTLRSKWHYFVGNIDGIYLKRGEKKILLEYHYGSTDNVDGEWKKILDSLNNISVDINLSIEIRRILLGKAKENLSFTFNQPINEPKLFMGKNSQ